MLIHTKTFNAHNINDTNYRAVVLNPYGSPIAKSVFLDQADSDSQDVGTYTVSTQNKALSITVLNYANRIALIAQLKTWFKRGTRGNLVVTFTDENVDYQMDCRVISLTQDQENPLHWIAVLETGNSDWRAVTADTEDPWEITGTGESLEIVVGGKDETYLNVELTAVAGPASGYLYQNIYRLPNTPGLAHGLIPWCITVNTAALVTAGKMQADCDDLRIVDLYTGQEIKRWISNPNNASTKVWINLNLSKGFTLPLALTVTDLAEWPYLQFTVNSTVQAMIAAMPSTGIIRHGNEWFYYTSVSSSLCRLYIGKRGLFGTPWETHSPGASFEFIQYPIAMKYGNSSVSSPASSDDHYDDTKPLIDLSTSSNTQWVYNTGTKFFDPLLPNRTAAWVPSRSATGPLSKLFNIKQDAETGDPALGMKVISYLVGTIWKAETVTLAWRFYREATITTVSMTGDKYRSGANWLGAAKLRRSSDGANYADLWSETTPTTAGAWATFTRNSVSVATGSKYLQLIFSGGFPGVADAYAAFEALTCTVDFASGNIPSAAFLGETANYPLEITIENLTNGDSISISYPMILDKTFVLNAEERSAKYDGWNAHSAIALDDESRSVWLRLVGGATNEIQISGTDVGTLDVDLSYYRRRL